MTTSYNYIYNRTITYNTKGEKTMLTKKQLAKELSISVPTIDKYMKQGMPYHKLGVKLVRFYLEEVKEWLMKGEK